jgi:hypothetical protein
MRVECHGRRAIKRSLAFVQGFAAAISKLSLDVGGEQQQGLLINSAAVE